MFKRISLLAVVLGLLASPAYAYQTEPSPWTKEATAEAKTLAKFKFGLRNMFFGWTEIFEEPYAAYVNKENIFKSAGAGVFNAVIDTAVGALHVVTSPIPGVDIPLPEGGV